MASKDACKKNEVECCSCLKTLEADHGGIRCPQGHHFCLEDCSPQYISTVLAEPQSNLPPHCPQCKADINVNVFLRILSPEQIEPFSMLMFEFVEVPKIASENETVCRCPFCSYIEFHVSRQEEMLFVHCRRDGCRKTSCYVCQQQYVEPEEDEEEEDDPNLQRHLQCMALGPLKRKFDRVLDLATSVPCPGCDMLGRKDGACNHMKCQNCDTDWCYVCGKTDSELDKSVPNNIYSHFDDWEYNENRCPMYMTAIAEVDDSWPDDEDAALELFHCKRTLLLLKQFYEEIGSQKWNSLYMHFDSVKNCGWHMEEFLQAPDKFYSTLEPGDRDDEELDDENTADTE